MALTSVHLPQYVSVSGTSTSSHAQGFAGINQGTINYGFRVTPDENAKTCRNALFLTDPQIDRQTLEFKKGKRITGTCEWIRADVTYNSWLQGDTQLLWISGGPGKGKTMLSIFLTEELESSAKHTEGAVVIYYFCSAGDEKRNSAVAVLRGLLYQLVSKHARLAMYLQQSLETAERTQSSLKSPETLWNMFTNVLRDPELGMVTCVLDGLDECDEESWRWLVAKVVDLTSQQTVRSGKSSFRIVLVSRTLPNMAQSAQVKLDPDNDQQVSSDIQRFISTSLQALLKLDGFNRELQTALQKTLLERAEGTFLWVGFAMNELLQKKTCTEVLEATRTLPKGLPAIYGRILRQIDSSRRQATAIILRWVTLAVRPLSLRELAAILESKSSGQLSVEQRVRDQVIACGPILKIQGDTVGLVHQSARDYLLRGEVDSDTILEALRITPEQGHLQLASACLSCICNSGLQYAALDLQHIFDNAKSSEHALLPYAVTYWPEHASHAAGLFGELLESYDSFFAKKSSLRENWWQTYGREKQRRNQPWLNETNVSLVHIACFLGIIPWARMLLAKTMWKLKSIMSPASRIELLAYAATGGNEAVLRLLLESGMDVNAGSRNGGTALERAIRSGFPTVVRLLLSHGADPTMRTKGSDWDTPLHVAVSQRQEAVVRLLLDHGADVNAKNKDEFTALHVASRDGEESIVRLLLAHRADVHCESKAGTTPLIIAAMYGHDTTVRLLLDSHAQINAKNGFGTALIWAISQGHESTVRLLLDHGADVNFTDDWGRAPLYHAAGTRHDAIVRLLLDFGARNVLGDITLTSVIREAGLTMDGMDGI